MVKTLKGAMFSRWSAVLVTAAVGAALVACQSGPAKHRAASADFDLYAPLQVPAPVQFAPGTPRPLKATYYAASWADVPGWDTDGAEQLWLTVVNNCRGLMRPVSGNLAHPARATPQDWQPFCQAVADMGASSGIQRSASPGTGNEPSALDLKHFIEAQLQPWALVEQGLATGYYEPVVHGSTQRSAQYHWPMYAPPEDLLTVDLGAVYPELAGKRVRAKVEAGRVVPYDTRAQIEAKADKPPVLAWLDDPVEGFFLQIQGSGRVQLPNGQALRLAYADHNGRPYTSIGRWLAEQGELPLAQTSMQHIKQWVRDNPHRMHELFNVNEAMVFFRAEAIQDELAGPKGAYGIPLVARRTIAVDPDYVPLGSPVFLSTTYPASHEPLQTLVFAQDTGGAIKGPARVDFFWGSGDEAGALAGRMKQPTQVWVLWPVGMGEPNAR